MDKELDIKQVNVGDTTEPKENAKKPFNIVEEINKDLEDNNVECSSENYFHWRRNGTIIQIDDLTNLLWCHRSQNNLRMIPKDNIITTLQNKEYGMKLKIFTDFKNRIKYSKEAVDSFEELCQIVTRENFHLMYPIVLRHIFWTVKRRMFGLPDYCPIFLNVYGAAGSGKSEFIKSMFSIFPHTLKSRVANASDLFNDERQTFRFVSNYVITMDELTGLNKTDMNKLKNQIDCEKIVYRQLGFNKIVEGKNNAQLIGTSNTRLQNTIFVDSDVRKWCEMDIFKYADNEVPEKMVKPLHQFNWLNLWQSVNENEDSPFHNPDTYQAFRRWTEQKCLTETPTVEFIKEYVQKNGGKFMPTVDIWQQYNLMVQDKQMSKPKLKELIEKYGYTPHRRNTARGFLVPTVSDCKYFSDEDKAEFNAKIEEW